MGGWLNKVSISLSDVFYLLNQVVLWIWLNARVKDFVIRIKTNIRVQRMDLIARPYVNVWIVLTWVTINSIWTKTKINEVL